MKFTVATTGEVTRGTDMGAHGSAPAATSRSTMAVSPRRHAACSAVTASSVWSQCTTCRVAPAAAPADSRTRTTGS